MSALGRLLNTSPRLRKQYLELFKDPIWRPVAGLTLDQERDLAFDRLQRITSEGLISVRWFKDNPTQIFDAHEYVGYMDGSTATKMTVQFNLFGGTVFNLSKTPDQKFITEIDQLKSIGCFGFTEKGYGNNAFQMESIASFEGDHFILNTPTEAATKSWITNSVCHANWGVVFAQLFDQEGVNHGPHPFLVQLRNQEGELLPGVEIEDMGWKLGLNGVDNGNIKLTNVKVPRKQLLNKIGNISAENGYQSEIEHPRKRFLKIADQLVSGRICISSMMLGCSKMMLTNTLAYSKNRKSVGRTGESDTPIINYGIQQQVLVPLLVDTLGLNLLLNRTKHAYAYANATQESDLMTLACIVKPMLAWHTQRLVCQCRELTGGAGFLVANQFGEAFAASQAGITAEGDAKVLCMKVSSEIVRDQTAGTLVRHIFPSFRPWSKGNLLKARHQQLVQELAFETWKSSDRYGVWMESHGDLVQQVALSYGELMIWEELNKNKNDLPELEPIREYYLAQYLVKHSGWLLAKGLMSKRQYFAATRTCRKLEKEIVHNLNYYLEGLQLPPHLHHAPMSH